MAMVASSVTDPDPQTDPDGDAGAETDDTAGSERGGGVARGPAADTDRRAEPRLANPPDGDADGDDRSVAGPEAPREPDPIEPETLRPENALFVLLGALGTVGLLATAVVPGLL